MKTYSTPTIAFDEGYCVEGKMTSFSVFSDGGLDLDQLRRMIDNSAPDLTDAWCGRVEKKLKDAVTTCVEWLSRNDMFAVCVRIRDIAQFTDGRHAVRTLFLCLDVDTNGQPYFYLAACRDKDTLYLWRSLPAKDLSNKRNLYCWWHVITRWEKVKEIFIEGKEKVDAIVDPIIAMLNNFDKEKESPKNI